MLVLGVLGLAATAAGGNTLWQLTGPPTVAQQAAAVRTEMAARWARPAAGQIFPATVGYVSPAGLRFTADRIGIVPWASCAAAADPPTAAALRRHGCIAVLRATYTDATGTLVMTAGVTVLPSVSAAQGAMRDSGAHGQTAQIRAVRFPGTVAAALFGDPRREIFGVDQVGPDLILVAMGYANGEYDHTASLDPALIDFAAGVVRTLAARVSGISHLCPSRESRC